MGFESEIEGLEWEWAPERGFFWKVRQGLFDENDFKRALARVAALSISESALLPRRLVSLLWYVPIFMQWQVERVREKQGDVSRYKSAITAMANEIERLLGVP